MSFCLPLHPSLLSFALILTSAWHLRDISCERVRWEIRLHEGDEGRVCGLTADRMWLQDAAHNGLMMGKRFEWEEELGKYTLLGAIGIIQ